MIILTLSDYEAIELANYLDDTDAHLSVGDRYLLAMRLRRLANVRSDAD